MKIQGNISIKVVNSIRETIDLKMAREEQVGRQVGRQALKLAPNEVKITSALHYTPPVVLKQLLDLPLHHHFGSEINFLVPFIQTNRDAGNVTYA